MAISHCPMCQTSIPNGENVKACGCCHSDLSRWMTQASTTPVNQAAGHDSQIVTRNRVTSHLGFGVVGAVVGACIGSGLMYGFYAMAGFSFPLLGIGIGFLTGLAAKWLNKGPDDRLGFVAGALSLPAVVGTLFLMYGTFPNWSIISVIASVSIAYRMAAF